MEHLPPREPNGNEQPAMNKPNLGARPFKTLRRNADVRRGSYCQLFRERWCVGNRRDKLSN